MFSQKTMASMILLSLGAQGVMLQSAHPMSSVPSSIAKVEKTRQGSTEQVAPAPPPLTNAVRLRFYEDKQHKKVRQAMDEAEQVSMPDFGGVKDCPACDGGKTPLTYEGFLVSCQCGGTGKVTVSPEEMQEEEREYNKQNAGKKVRADQYKARLGAIDSVEVFLEQTETADGTDFYIFTLKNDNHDTITTKPLRYNDFEALKNKFFRNHNTVSLPGKNLFDKWGFSSLNRRSASLPKVLKSMITASAANSAAFNGLAKTISVDADAMKLFLLGQEYTK